MIKLTGSFAGLLSQGKLKDAYFCSKVTMDVLEILAHMAANQHFKKVFLEQDDSFKERFKYILIFALQSDSISKA